MSSNPPLSSNPCTIVIRLRAGCSDVETESGRKTCCIDRKSCLDMTSFGLSGVCGKWEQFVEERVYRNPGGSPSNLIAVPLYVCIYIYIYILGGVFEKGSACGVTMGVTADQQDQQ